MDKSDCQHDWQKTETKGTYECSKCGATKRVGS